MGLVLKLGLENLLYISLEWVYKLWWLLPADKDSAITFSDF